MKKKPYFFRKLIVIILIFPSFSLIAQKDKIKLGEIKDEYKNYKDCDFAPGSGAVYFINNGNKYVQGYGQRYRYYSQIHKVIKILNKDGLDIGNIKFEGYGEIIKLKASTYNEVDGVWEETEFDKKNLHTKKGPNEFSKKEYTVFFPEVRVGSIIEFYAELEGGFLIVDFSNSWVFQQKYPVISSQYKYPINEDTKYSIDLVSHYDLKINPVEEYNVNTVRGKEKFKIHSYSANNLPPINYDESFSPNPNLYASRVNFYLVEYLVRNFFVRGNILSKNYEEYTLMILNDSPDGKKMKNTKGLLDKLGVEISETDGIEERIDKVSRHIQSNFEADENVYPLFKEDSFSKLIKRKKVNPNDLAILLVAALRDAKVKAYPIRYNRRGTGFPYPLHPRFGQLNKVSCVVFYNDEYRIIDVSNNNLHYKMLDYGLLNGNGYIIDLKHQQWLPMQDNAISSETYYTNLIMKDGVIFGELKAKLQDYAAYSFYTSETNEELKEEKENFKSTLDDWEIKKIKFDEINNEKPIIVEADIFKEIGDDDLIYIQPVLYKLFNENPFVSKERLAPINFPYKYQYKHIYSIEIPEGYELEDAPASIKMDLLNNKGYFSYLLEEKGNKIFVHVNVRINSVYFSPDEYQFLQTFFSSMYDYFDNVIVLKKK